MRAAVLIAIAAACCIVWLMLGSRIVLLVDGLFPDPPSPKAIHRLEIAADSLVSGAALTLDSRNRTENRCCYAPTSRRKK